MSRKAALAHKAPVFEEEPDLPPIWRLFGQDALMQRFLLLAKMIERTTSRQLQGQYGMSVAQWRVLGFICMSGPATASFIGEAAEADQAEISRAVKGLLADGFVLREFAPGSRKTMVIAPTARGEELFREIRARRQRYFARITARLTPAEKAAFIAAMGLIAEDMVRERTADGREGPPPVALRSRPFPPEDGSALPGRAE